MRLLQVTTVAVTLRAFLLPWARHHRAKGWRVDGLARDATSCDRSPQAFDHVYDVPWSRHPLAPGNFVHAMRRIRTLVRDNSYDLVHVHTPVAGFVTRFALRHGSVPVVYTAHGFHFHAHGDPLRNTLYVSLEKLAGQWTDQLVVINQADHQAARSHRLVPRERLTWIPGVGVDLSLLHPGAVRDEDEARLRAELDLSPDRHIFVMIAEFNSNKRHRDLVEALARLRRPDVTVVLAGSGPMEDRIRGLAAQRGLSEQIRFLGIRNDVPVLITAALALILPSQREGLSRSIQEAMALGKPTIASDIRGNRDLLQDGGGLLFPLGDIDALATAMRRLLDEPDLRTRTGRRAREIVRRFDLAAVLGSHDELYERTLARRRR